MADKGRLEQTIMQCLFVSYPRGGGKSSLIRCLTGQSIIPSLPSTGVVDKIIQVEVRKVTTSAVLVSPDEITHSVWRIFNFIDEAIALMTISSRQTEELDRIETKDIELTDEEISAESLYHTAPPVSDSDVKQKPLPQSAMNASVLSTSAPMKLMMDAVEQVGLEGIQKYLDKSLTLYLTDTGGQIEFQELLPALVAGHFIVFLVFRLDQDLNKTFIVDYLHPKGQSAQPYQFSFTTIETLLQSLASIASMGTYMFNDPQQSMSATPMKPKIVFVGTHKDQVSTEQIEQIDNQLQQLVKETDAYRCGLIEYASEEIASQARLVLAVNNLSPDDSDFDAVRSVVERISSRGDFRVIAPSTWLIFSLFLRQLGKKIITYDECLDHAHSCGIDSSEELNEALWFLHKKLGLIRYFHGEGLEDLQNIVIIDPQILFDTITRLIIETFTFRKASSFAYDEFKEKGIFSLSTLRKISCEDEDKLLTLDQFIKLLQHLHVIARLHEEKSKFFMPCALAHVTSTAPILAQASTQAQPAGKVPSEDISPVQPPPLLVTFKCGFCPRGLFGAISVYLLANKMKSKFTWKLQKDKIYRNSISFSVTPFDSVALRVEPNYLEVSVARVIDHTFSIKETCVEVKKCIELAVEEVTSSLNYTYDAKHTITFYCTNHHMDTHDKHPGEIQCYENEPCTLLCPLLQCVSYLPSKYELWFNEVSMGVTNKSDQDERTLELFDSLYTIPLQTGAQGAKGGREDEVLSGSKDLRYITEYLLDLETVHIYHLGIELGLKQSHVKKMMENPLTFLDDVVSAWLRMEADVRERPTWRVLVKALRRKRVGQTGIASKIERERCSC